MTPMPSAPEPRRQREVTRARPARPVAAGGLPLNPPADLTADQALRLLYREHLLLYPCPDDGSWTVLSNPALRSRLRVVDGELVEVYRHQAVSCGSGNSPAEALGDYARARRLVCLTDPAWRAAPWKAPSDHQLERIARISTAGHRRRWRLECGG